MAPLNRLVTIRGVWLFRRAGRLIRTILRHIVASASCSTLDFCYFHALTKYMIGVDVKWTKYSNEVFWNASRGHMLNLDRHMNGDITRDTVTASE